MLTPPQGLLLVRGPGPASSFSPGDMTRSSDQNRHDGNFFLTKLAAGMIVKAAPR